ERACYEDVMSMQIEEAIALKGEGNLDALLRGKETWTIS
ncbi:MAG: 2-oxoacid:ferredoxin oxidoreductase subunit beta, partial [Chitinophagaceae bacterium]